MSGKQTLPGAQIVLRALEDEGIEFAFGIPGTHNIELYDALAESKKIQTILVTDEQSASFMADGVWRSSGKLACVNVVPGAGLTHALSGIAEAFMDQIPMLVLGCGIRQDTGKAFQLHDVDQLSLVKAVTKKAFRPLAGSEIYQMVRQACSIARQAPGGPVFVEIPANLYFFQHEVSFNFTDDHARLEIAPGLLDRAADLLNRAKRPLLYVGNGAVQASKDLVPLAERLQSPVATTIQGKGVFPEGHALFLWPGFGKTAPPTLSTVADHCDATLAIGCRFGEVATGSYGVNPPKPLIHVDIDPAAFNRNYPADLVIRADALDFVQGILPKLAAKESQSDLPAQLAKAHAEIWQQWIGTASKTRVTPHALLVALQNQFGPQTIFTVDSGNGTFLGMEHLRLNKPRKFLGPIDYSCMGYSVPAAIGAKLACPEMPVVALVGDGALLMTGLEILTAVQRQLPVLFVVLRDRELAQIAQFQQVAFNRKPQTTLGEFDLEGLSVSLGAMYAYVENDGEIPFALKGAADILSTEKRPVVMEVAIDYSEKTYFTRGVVKTNFNRLPFTDRLRFLGRALTRKITG